MQVAVGYFIASNNQRYSFTTKCMLGCLANDACDVKEMLVQRLWEIGPLIDFFNWHH